MYNISPIIWVFHMCIQCILIIFIPHSPQNQSELSIYSWMWSYSLKHGWPTEGHTVKENLFPFPSIHQLSTPVRVLDSWLTLSCGGKHSGAPVIANDSPWFRVPISFLAPFLQQYLSLVGKDMWYRCPSMAEHYMVFYSLFLGQLWVSALTAIHSTSKPL